MTEHLPPDPNETPEDVASLYSWANLHGGKYRDFSASRAETREKSRQRMEEAIEEERQRAHRKLTAQPAAEAGRIAEESRAARIGRAAGRKFSCATREAAGQVRAASSATIPTDKFRNRRHRSRPPQDRHPAPPPQPASPPAPDATQPIASHDDAVSQQRAPWLSTDSRENPDRPAWLMPEQPEP